jgi:malonyl-CoA/methylmalonyl-CoA synthetase
LISALSLPLRGRGLSWAVSSGAPLDATTAHKIDERLGWRLVEFYGSTESGGISFNPDKLNHSGSVGHQMPHIEVKGLSGAEQAGVLEVRGPTVSDWAYEGGGRIRLTGQAGWYPTNDAGYIDGDGRLYLLGRTVRLIKVAGKRVSLDSIEAALLSMPGVMDAAVSARVDRIHGEVPVAEVVPTPDSGLSLEALLQECQRRLPPHKRPREIRLRERIQRRRISKGPVTENAMAQASEEQ